MAQAKLRARYRYRTLIGGLLAVLVMGTLSACREDGPIGMTLLFQSAGRSVGVMRFDPDGLRGPVPGSVGGMSPRGGAQMTFMPGDSTRPVPEFVDVEWMVATEEYDQAWENLARRSDRYSPKWMADVDKVNADAPHYTRRINLTPILTPDLIAKVRADRRNTHLKLIITFNNETVDITAETEKWR